MAYEKQLITSANEVKATETDTGPEEYASNLGFSLSELQKLLANRTVLDLGSGPGGFAANLEAWKMIGVAAPTRVDSLNLRYAAPDYKTFSENVFAAGNTRFVQPPGLNANKDFPQAVTQTAWDNAKKNFIGLDWNNLSSLPDNTYDIIVSVYAFPFYSDLIFLKPESDTESEMFRKNGSFFKFGEQSKNVFKEIIRITKSNGLILLHTDLLFSFWEASPNFKIEIQDFVRSLGCDLEVVQVNRSVSFRIKKRAE